MDRRRAAAAFRRPDRRWDRAGRALREAYRTWFVRGPEGDWMARAVAACDRPGVLVLDAGAGEARLRGAFRHARYVALDLAARVRAWDAWDFSSLDSIGDLHALPLQPGACDVAIANSVLEHVADPEPCLQELRRALRPGGCLLLFVPQSWPLHHPPDDFLRFTRFGVARLLERAGFTVEELTAAGGAFTHAHAAVVAALEDDAYAGAPAVRTATLPLRRLLRLALHLALPAAFALDLLDARRDATLGWFCRARVPVDTEP